MDGIAPRDFETVGQLRDALNRGRIQYYRAFIAAVNVDGNNIGDSTPRDVSGKITYSIVLVDTDDRIDPAVLTDMTPHNRPGNNIRVIGPRRFSPVEIAYVNVNGSPQIMLFLRSPEYLDQYTCAGKPVHGAL